MTNRDILEVEALARVLDDARAEDVVTATLRDHRELDNDARATFSRRVYGASVLRARLAFLAGASAPAKASALVDAYVRFVEERAPIDHVVWPSDPLERMCVERSAPMFMVQGLVDALGVDGADAFLAASNEPAPATLRANTLKCTRAQLAERLRNEGIETREHKLSSTALVVEGRANLFGTRAWRDGWFEVQDASSQACIEACIDAGVKPGAVVVDLCAGRGGKTLALAAAMKNDGALYVHDVDRRALADMQPRLARAGVTCVDTLDDDNPRADVVLVDAPCSSWGPLRRSPDLRWTQREDELAPFSWLQQKIVARARTLLRRGGRVVYATCTARRAENDDVVAGGRLLLPHVDDCDGFYIAIE